VTKILIVDDHTLFRQGLRRIIEDRISTVEFGEAESAESAMTLLNENHWDVILLDINLPGRSGLDLLKDIRIVNNTIPILVLSMYEEDQFAVRAIRAGCNGYLPKDCAPDNLLEALDRLLSGQKYITPNVARLLADELQTHRHDTAYQSLSDREFQVLKLIGAGKTVSEIGIQLSLSVKTISTYRSNILAKLNLRNNSQLILYAMKNELID